MTQHQRRIKFIDPSLQGKLMAALVLLESLMVILAMIYLYWRFSALIEERMFSIHVAAQDSFLQLLLLELVWVVVFMSGINFVALLIANGLWGRNIGRIISAFRIRLFRMGRLDVSASQLPAAPDHEVLQHLDGWRRREEKKMRQIKALSQRIMKDDPEAEAQLNQLLSDS
ncbi:hypothetical protein [Shewanella cyperi]|uniref:hypothetical protein n=1 Tax=Shewanella cyperi TaxID=2814292 RepID=UPI001A947170|nr:hypothetical protein [Shewanella cyperi]QSX39992.1 hypothetical protein JYB84_13520 [Shewanella cyperi]